MNNKRRGKEIVRIIFMPKLSQTRDIINIMKLSSTANLDLPPTETIQINELINKATKPPLYEGTAPISRNKLLLSQIKYITINGIKGLCV